MRLAALALVILAVAACEGAVPRATPSPAPVASSPAQPGAVPELEAMLPSTLCDEPVTKVSATGAMIAASTDAFFRLETASLFGRKPEDLAVASIKTSGSAGFTCSVQIVRVPGATAAELEAALAKQGGTAVGSRPYVRGEYAEGGLWYADIAGDTLRTVSGPEARIAEMFASLP